MEIKASCTLDLNAIKALNGLMMFRKNDPKKRMILWGIIYAVIIVCVIMLIATYGLTDEFALYLFMLFAFLLLGCYLYFLQPRVQYKAMAKLKNAENRYVFRDETMDIISAADAFNGQSELRYSVIVRAMETSKYFFIFQTKNQAFLVDKSTITDGTPEQIREKLRSHLGKKYMLCRY